LEEGRKKANFQYDEYSLLQQKIHTANLSHRTILCIYIIELKLQALEDQFDEEKIQELEADLYMFIRDNKKDIH
jgi:hypothetical protein